MEGRGVERPVVQQSDVPRPEFRWTTRTLTAGTLAAGACLLVGLALTVLGVEAGADDPRRLDAVLRGVVELRPWGWSLLGVIVLLATPAAALVATFVELRPGQPRVALLALAVLAVLAAAVIIALR